MNEVDHVYSALYETAQYTYIQREKKEYQTIKLNWAYLQEEETIMNEQ